jgi:membrane protein DedA with SNARE-associated domain
MRRALAILFLATTVHCQEISVNTPLIVCMIIVGVIIKCAALYYFGVWIRKKTPRENTFTLVTYGDNILQQLPPDVCIRE